MYLMSLKADPSYFSKLGQTYIRFLEMSVEILPDSHAKLAKHIIKMKWSYTIVCGEWQELVIVNRLLLWTTTIVQQEGTILELWLLLTFIPPFSKETQYDILYPSHSSFSHPFCEVDSATQEKKKKKRGRGNLS